MAAAMKWRKNQVRYRPKIMNQIEDDRFQCNHATLDVSPELPRHDPHLGPNRSVTK
jgi:hypothetical protein